MDCTPSPEDSEVEGPALFNAAKSHLPLATVDSSSHMVEAPAVSDIAKSMSAAAAVNVSSLNDHGMTHVYPSASSDEADDMMTGTTSPLGSKISRKSHSWPARPCPYCGNLKIRLSRHLRAVHKNQCREL